MTEHRAALLKLLDDDDPATLALLKAQLTGAGIARLDELRQLLAHASGTPARHLREVISHIEAREADALFGQVCADFGEHGAIENAAWRLAATFLPGEDFARQRGFLDAWATEVRRRIQKAESDEDRIETLVEFLGHDVGLRGNTDDYYNINNSLLPEVIDTRQGLPITLSLIYVLVGRRAGVEMKGVGLPGNFIVRSGEHFFDPFQGGMRLGMDDCRALALQHGVALQARHLQPVTPRQFLTRMLTNIRTLCESADPALAAKTSGWLDALAAGA